MNVPTPASSPTLDPNWQAKYGVPVYVGSDGSLYIDDGAGNAVPYEPPPSSTTAPSAITPRRFLVGR
jgi:hypothetical protein